MQAGSGASVTDLNTSWCVLTVYESTKSALAYRSASTAYQIPQPLIHAISSATAELASCAVITPAEVVKQNAQMLRQRSGSSGSQSSANGKGSTSSSMEALRRATAGRGANMASVARKLLAGYSALAARNLPFTSVQFPLFEALRARLWLAWGGVSGGGGGGGSRKGGSITETGLVSGASAALAGALAAAVTTPSDVIKTRMMLAAGGSAEGSGEHVVKEVGKRSATAGADKRSFVAVARQIYAERGVRGLFRGGWLRATWTAAGSGLYLGVYEASRVWLMRGKDAPDEDDGWE